MFEFGLYYDPHCRAKASVESALIDEHITLKLYQNRGWSGFIEYHMLPPQP